MKIIEYIQNIFNLHDNQDNIDNIDHLTKRRHEIIAYIIFCILGIGNLFPYNAFVTASSYYENKFCNTSYETSFESYFSVIYSISQPIALLINIYYSKEYSIRSLVLYPLYIYIMVFILTTIMVGIPSISGDTLFILTLFSTFICGFSGSIMNGGLFALSGILPPQYTSSMMHGQALAGVIVSIVEIIATSTTPYDCNDDDNNDDDSCSSGDTISGGDFSYFLVSCIVLTLCAFLFLILLKLPFVRHRIITNLPHDKSYGRTSKSIIQREMTTSVLHSIDFDNDNVKIFQNDNSNDNSNSSNDNILQPEQDTTIVRNNMEETNYDESSHINHHTTTTTTTTTTTNSITFDSTQVLRVNSIIAKCAYSVFLIFFGTLMVFPAVMVLITPVHSCQSSRLYGDLWLPVLFLLLNSGDLIGRIIAEYYRQYCFITPENIHIYTTIRLIIPLMLLVCHIDNNHVVNIINNDVLIMLIVLLLGISNGLIANLAMMYAPLLVKEEDSALAGTIMMFWLSAGLLIGSALSFLMIYIVDPGSV
jgi:hypothetical protein